MSHTSTTQRRHTTALVAEELTSHFPGLADVVGDREVYLLRADLAGPSGSFKDFGVSDVIRNLARAGHRECSTASAGSHALALLKPCAENGLRVHVLLPHIASKEKIRKIHQLWHELGQKPEDLTVTLVGGDLDETLQYVNTHIDPATFIHAYDNVDVIKGRRDIYHTALQAVPTLTDLVVPIGGGSLFTALTTCGNTWGVEAQGSDSLSKSLRARSNTPLRATSPNDKFGGCTVRYTGQNVLGLLASHPEATYRILTATNEQVRSVAQLYETFTPEVTLEPTSLVAIAGLPYVLEHTPSHAVVGVISTGHNESYTNLLNPKQAQN